MLLVSPAPTPLHQVVVLETAVLSKEACPHDMRVLPAPLSVRPSKTTELQPDVLVARKADLTGKDLPTAPLLAVEVLSPSSVLKDLNLKKAAYQRMGVQNYWVIDPRRASLTAFELDRRDFTYQLIAEVVGDKTFEATQPFAVSVVPQDLLDGMVTESED